MIRTLKQHYGKLQLRKLQKQRHHKAISINWDEIKRLGILYQCQSERDFITVKTFSEGVPEQIGLSTLGYVDAKELTDFHIQAEPFRFYCQADLNWYYKPVSSVTRDFIHEPFDLLINLCDEDILPLNFVLLKSHARLIAGDYTKKQWHDIMIKTDKNAPKTYLLEQIVRYLKMIKTT
ncbi:MAG: DUF6913 domain-containing protein [Bacteroidales bacterium]